MTIFPILFEHYPNILVVLRDRVYLWRRLMSLALPNSLKTGARWLAARLGETAKRCAPLVRRAVPIVLAFLKRTFLTGPRVLLTSRISERCAALMVLLCIPSLLFSTICYVSIILFASPEQKVYFHFAQILNEDPARWITLLLSGACALLALAMPASLPGPKAEVRY